MDNLRRLRLSRYLPKAAPPRRGMGEAGPPAFLRGADRRLAAALDQLRAGVPLNWRQMEDDPELAILSRLQDVAHEGRNSAPEEAPAVLKATIIEELAPRLPEPKPQPVVVQPKPLAGFSESVPVLTQVEDEIPPLTVNVRLIAAVVGGVVLLLLGLWAASNLSHTSSPPTFGWIEVRQGGQIISRQQRSASLQAIQCRVPGSRSASGQVRFWRTQSLQAAQADAGFSIASLPVSMTVPSSYTLVLANASLDPCDGNNFQPSDPGAMAKLQYQVSHWLIPPTSAATSTGPFDNIRRIATEVTPLTLFEMSRQTASIDVTRGTWKEMQAGAIHGVYWRGGPYRDIEGIEWIGDVEVLMIERGDMVMTLVTQANQGVTEESLLEMVKRAE